MPGGRPMYIDSHCHITCDQLYSRIDEVIRNMCEVNHAMIICTNKSEFSRALQVKETYGNRFKIAWGWYPGDVKDIDESHYQILQEAIDYKQIDCLGEIGLDYYWDTSFIDKQKEAFIRQIHMANKANLTIAIHMREATKDTLDILREHAQTKVIMHCFSGSVETMKECIKQGYLISLAGPITFKNARHAIEVAKECPLAFLLTETDSPYLTPVPYRGKQNEPKYVSYVTQKIAEIKDMNVEEVANQIQDNFISLIQREK